MRLNLVYPERSDIKYEVHKFPDGQQNISLDSKPLEFASYSLLSNHANSVEIVSRLNNFRDLELIVCAVASLREARVKEIYLYVPYILGSRSDRKFSEGGNNYLKDVICPILNSLELESITTLDPHSDCLEMGLKRYKKQDNEALLQFFIDGQHNRFSATTVLISPDAGASKKIFKIAEKINYKGEIITCSKDRDEKGKLAKCIVPEIRTGLLDKEFVIIDDICDGGRTFINIAEIISKRIKTFGIKPKIHLIVTHGIFSKGFSELSQYFDSIHCTNSYSDILAISFESNEKGNHKVDLEKLVKQLNVF